MALGGGTFERQDKILPGAYINFVSAARAGALLSERGYAALPLSMDWGPSEEVFRLTAEAFQKQSQAIFGYEYTHEKVKGIRDVFRSASFLYGYRINGRGRQASCSQGQARYVGERGNRLLLSIQREGERYVVKTYLEGKEMDSQAVATAAELKDNDYVLFDRETALEETAGLPFTGGTNGAPAMADYQKFLDKIQPYSFHAMGLLSDDREVKKLFADFTRRMREEQGIKFQTVLYRYPADDEGIISLANYVAGSGTVGTAVLGETALKQDGCGLVYWVTGAAAGCPVNGSNTNRTYDGEYEPDIGYTQEELEEAIQSGTFILHRVGDEIRVLEDINTLVTYTQEKGEDFSNNQTIRVLDQIGNDIAALFGNKYLGKIPNDEAGRISFWNDLVTYYRELETMRAIETFEADDIVVEKGEGKRSIVASCPVTPVNAMSQLYMTVVVQ